MNSAIYRSPTLAASSCSISSACSTCPLESTADNARLATSILINSLGVILDCIYRHIRVSRCSAGPHLSLRSQEPQGQRASPAQGGECTVVPELDSRAERQIA